MIIINIILLSFLYSDISPGYTLFSPLPNQGGGSYTTYLIDNNGEYINTWTHDCKPVSISYLLPDSSLVIPCTQNEVNGLGGGNQLTGGRILKLSWDGNILWDDIFLDSSYQPHHDIEPLPNGNVLFITYERKSYSEAILAGRVNINNEIWPSYILELEQVSLDSSKIIWEWHLWDHTIQDIDSTLSNYGIISDYPGLLDINLGTLGGGGGSAGDWLHLNAIDYNPEFNLIAISSRKMNEFYFIDHSTTTEQAATSSGGNFNRGGNFIYRWGNPQNYHRGDPSDKKLTSQHSVNWIDNNYPGGGNIILFNNRTEEVGSEIMQITIPIDNFLYELNSQESHPPENPSWTYSDGSFFSNIQSGALRLENGNTLISIGDSPTFFEIDSLNNEVWNYTFTGPSGQSFNGNIARAQKYSTSYMEGNLIPGDLNSDSIVNILDVILLVDLIVNETIEFNYSSLYDLNQDESIDILDIVLLINIILGNY